MNKITTTCVTLFTLTVSLASATLPNVALAGSKGRKNTTIGLGAAAVHQAVKGKKTNAVVLGAGTAYAYKRYRDARKSEKRRERAARARAYRSRTAYGAASTRTRRVSTTRRTRHSHVNGSGRRFYHTHSGPRSHRH